MLDAGVDLQTLVRCVPAVLYSFTVNHATGESGFRYVSDYVETMFGLEPRFVYENPKTLADTIHEDDVDGYTEAVVESMQNMTPFNRRVRARRADNGEVLTAHFQSVPKLVEETSTGDDGQETTSTLTMWDGVVMDVTRQVNDESSNLSRVSSTIESSLQPIFEIDMAGAVSRWNRPMEVATGYGAEEAIGRPITDLVSDEDDRGVVRTLVDGALNTGEYVLPAGPTLTAAVASAVMMGVPPADGHATAVERDCVLLSKQGKRVYLHAKCTRTSDCNGTSTGLLFCCHDTTRIREAENQRKQALELVDAERGLMEWLSHEVRNPLSVSLEAANALKEGGLFSPGGGGSEEEASYVDLICDSMHYIVDLLTNMLDLNKCLDGKIMLNSRRTRLREEVLVPTFKMMKVRGRNMQMRLLDGEEEVAWVDPLRLRQVVTNLLSNAIKFTAEGYINLSLRRTSRSSHHPRRGVGEMLCIAVSDSGCGIKESDHDVLFTKWEQLGSQRNGTGIGLCLCQALVRAMGGDISITKMYDSGIDGHPGSEFNVFVPVSALQLSGGSSSGTGGSAFESVKAAVKTVHANGGGSFSSNDGRATNGACPEQKGNSIDMPNVLSNGNENNDNHYKPQGGATKKAPPKDAFVRGSFNMLIVDDDKVGRRLLRKRFSRLFPEADIDDVASGEQAVSAVDGTHYDVITMDHFMAVEDMNGEETIRELRAKNVDALIVGISGNSKEKEHLSAGAQEFFQKPIPSDDVLLERFLNVMAPPCGWKVLCVDDAKVNIHFLRRRLLKVAAPHFTTLQEAEKRWDISSATNGEDAMRLLSAEWFDLVILDQHMGDDSVTGSYVASFAREHAANKNAVIVLNTGSMSPSHDSNTEYNLFWPKPLPSTEQMRLDLCRELLIVRK